MKYVGITTNDGLDLYCEDWGNEYHVVNGCWNFKKEHTDKIIFSEPGGPTVGTHKKTPWRVVLPNMLHFGDDYEAACIAIRDAVNNENSTKPQEQFSMF